MTKSRPHVKESPLKHFGAETEEFDSALRCHTQALCLVPRHQVMDTLPVTRRVQSISTFDDDPRNFRTLHECADQVLGRVRLMSSLPTSQLFPLS